MYYSVTKIVLPKALELFQHLVIVLRPKKLISVFKKNHIKLHYADCD